VISHVSCGRGVSGSTRCCSRGIASRLSRRSVRRDRCSSSVADANPAFRPHLCRFDGALRTSIRTKMDDVFGTTRRPRGEQPMSIEPERSSAMRSNKAPIPHRLPTV
jgi:hypothetical protein